MRTPIEALKEIRDRLTYFCLRTDGKYDPPWATELVGIIDDILEYKKNTDNPFYVDIGTSIVAIRCSSNHDVVHRLDHAYNKGSITYLEQMCARMNEEALGFNKSGNAAAMHEALVQCELFLGNVSRHGHPTLCLGDQCTACNGVDDLRGQVVRALSAPPRNCDRFVTQPEMSRAYEEYRKSAMKSYGNGLTGRVPTVKQKPMTYDEWMLAPAVERKGEN